MLKINVWEDRNKHIYLLQKFQEAVGEQFRLRIDSGGEEILQHPLRGGLGQDDNFVLRAIPVYVRALS